MHTLCPDRNLGGKNKKLAMSSGALIKQIYLLLLNNKLKDYSVDIECTHHGPTLNRPVVFLEIGCSPKEWNDKRAKKVIINVLKSIKSNFSNKSVIVLGGDHYMRNISYLLRTNLQISHMCPSNHLPNFDEILLTAGWHRRYEELDFIVIDLAAVGQHHNRLIKMLDDNNIPYKYVHELKLSLFDSCSR